VSGSFLFYRKEVVLDVVALERWRQEDQESEASLGYIETLSQVRKGRK
jgi:hypothetical protein